MCVFCMQAFSIKDNTNFKPQLEIIEKAVEVPAIAWGETFFISSLFLSFALALWSRQADNALQDWQRLDHRWKEFA